MNSIKLMNSVLWHFMNYIIMFFLYLKELSTLFVGDQLCQKRLAAEAD